MVVKDVIHVVVVVVLHAFLVGAQIRPVRIPITPVVFHALVGRCIVVHAEPQVRYIAIIATEAATSDSWQRRDVNQF